MMTTARHLFFACAWIFTIALVAMDFHHSDLEDGLNFIAALFGYTLIAPVFILLLWLGATSSSWTAISIEQVLVLILAVAAVVATPAHLLYRTRRAGVMSICGLLLWAICEFLVASID